MRELEKGPERKIVTFIGTAHDPKLAVLECGHEIHKPPVQKTKRMILPKAYRCIQCRDNSLRARYARLTNTFTKAVSVIIQTASSVVWVRGKKFARTLLPR